MDIMSFSALVGGLGLFIFGMNILAESLEKAAGNKLKGIIELLTKNRFIAATLGAAITILVQSSSTSTVMVIGLVNSGVMKLSQSVGIIMGANIGTTTTAWIVSSSGDVFDMIVPLLLGIGAFIALLTSKKKIRNLALIAVGFGILFIGMDLMKEAVKPLRESVFFLDLISKIGDLSFKSIFLGILIGTVFTAVIQSSSASTAVFIAMASSGILPIESAIPLIYGANIGTCITALLASIAANRVAKQTAAVHIIFNLLGTIIFIPLTSQLANISQILASDEKVQLAIAHTIFNVSTTLILIWFTPQIAKLAEKIVPLNDNDIIPVPIVLDDRLLVTPPIAFSQMEDQIYRLSNLTLECYNASVKSILKKDIKFIEKTFTLESIINESQLAIYDYIIKLTNVDGLSYSDKEKLDDYIRVITDFERIGDHSENIAELSEYAIEKKLVFSEVATSNLTKLTEKISKSCSQANRSFKDKDLSIAASVIRREGEIDFTYEQLRKEHINRLKENKCGVESGIVFLDILTNLERIADHADNIAETVYRINEVKD